MSALKRVADALFGSATVTDTLGTASYPLLYLNDHQPIDGRRAPDLVHIEGNYLQVFMPGLGGSPESAIKDMMARAAQTSLTQIADYNKRVLIVGPGTRFEDAKTIADARYGNAIDAINAHKALLATPGDRNAVSAQTAKPGGPAGAGTA